MIYENQEQLDADLAFWQKQLRLQDWHISAVLVDDKDIGAQGKALRNLQHRCGYIRISREHFNSQADLSPEERLVHELLHMYHWNENQSEDEVMTEEQGINATAILLVRWRKQIDG